MSKYLDSFKQLALEGSDSFQLIGDCLIVEELVEANEVKTAGGIIVQGTDGMRDGFEQNKPTFVRVLAVGEGYYDEEGKTVPIDANPGDIVLVGALSVKWLSTFGPIISIGKGERLGITRESEIQLRFKGQNGYDEVFRILGATAEHRTDSPVSRS